jgi:aryl-alcohol dehydrogenase-like predicted oxidoreductase
MKTIGLPKSDKIVPQLGFGCAYIVSGLEGKSAVRCLQAAFEVGLRHFDVAPSYGMGTAEDVLGTALRMVRDEVSIASKAGLTRPKGGGRFLVLRSIASPLRHHLPGITRTIGARLSGGGTRRYFNVKSIEESLSESLRRLRTDYLDLFFLHEAHPMDVSDDVLTFLDKCRVKGVVRAVGIASTFESIVEILHTHPHFFDVVQYSWNVLNGELIRPGGTFVVTHRALLGVFEPLRAWLRTDRSAATRLSAVTGVDLGSDDILADVLLGAALNANEFGIVLAASRRINRIRHFGEIMGDPNIRAAGGRLTAALFEESNRPNLRR